MSAVVIIGGNVPGKGAEAQHALRINAVAILLVYNSTGPILRNFSGCTISNVHV